MTLLQRMDPRNVLRGLPSEEALVTSVVRVAEEVARRLERELAADRTTVELSGPAFVTVRTTTITGGQAGPVIEARVDDSGGIAVDLGFPEGDPWASAATGLAEMHAELLGALLGDPDLDLAAAPALSKATEAAVLGPLAGLAVDHGPFRSVPEQILAAAEQTPQAVAVYAADGTLTYQELVSRARETADQLREVAEPGVLVPVLVSDGRALPVAWTAAMFAGVGYVPMDPRWPAERIERILGQLDEAPLLCVDPALVPTAHRERSIVINLADDLRGKEIEDVFAPGAGDVVYGIYTSGTTGTPQCAVNLHRGLANRLAFMSDWFGPPPGREVVLQNTRHTYDSAFWQVFWPLTTGGTTVIPSGGEHLDLLHTIETIEGHGVTVTDFVPSVLNALLSLLEQRPALLRSLRTLRHLVVGGEQINAHDVHRIRQLLPGLRVSNGYGPTEAAIGMIFHEVTEADGDDVPLGRPIDNCAAVVVDVDGNPVPPGVTGEIFIGGACIGLGYHDEPVRTAARFFDCPWPAAGPVLSGRMYRTGDRGHLDELGRFHFAGRIDHQIKVGGVRIEPGEVEAAALAFPGVSQAVALVVNRELVLVATGTATGPEILGYLRTRLPRSSVPQRCVVVEEMALTDSGKTDRRELAKHADLAVGAGEATGDEVLDLLRSAARRPDLAAGDDVFAAGVNSLQAVAVTVAFGRRFGVEIGVRDLVEHPSADALRKLLEGEAKAPDTAALVAADLLSVPRREPQAVRTVFLTGATGFVGTHLLFELLQDPELSVVCLVRGRDVAQAQERLAAALAGQGLEHPGFTTRTRVVAGDLALEGLGLSDSRWRELAAETDLVLHNGAMVNFLYDYRMHREPNVRGTAEMIRFAREAGGIPLHYVSTLGALHDQAVLRSGAMPEDVDLRDVKPPQSGYSLSKWVAERLLQTVSDLPVTVLRLGEVMPAENQAGTNPTAVTHLLLSAFEQLGMAPQAQLRTDWSPVDEVARVVASSVRERWVWGSALHVYRPGTVHLEEHAPVQVPCLEFLAELRKAGLTTLLAIIEHRGAGRLDTESGAREVLENLLQDNPTLFQRRPGMFAATT